MLNGLDLFSGIGGLSVALNEWVRPIAYCEIDPYCQGVLLSRMADCSISRAPIWNDITTFPSNGFAGAIDIIYGGFPCQDISVAGRGKGLEAERSGLFFEILRITREVNPSFLFLENVPAITTRGGCQVVSAIAEMGYDCRWLTISAASIGALHRRERWFLLAHTCSERRQQECRSSLVHEIQNEGRSEISNNELASEDKTITREFWKVEPNVGRVADGIPQRMDRLRALGNAVVPQQAKEAFKILMGLK